ncbi:YsnF/AvaK domain-containing protein [Salinicoccus sp. HZC-1]|uniref:YsnF/AvaK domain-containing protein n=1 Tax=Salinicoccus sp. HZC-1 TaxID=3385497 RepID=UPI00398AE2AE
MGKIESFSQEGQLLNRIEHYKQKGLEEDRLTVISSDGLGDTLIDYPNVTHKTAEGDAWDKIAAWIAGEDPENQVMDRLHLDDEEKEVYRKSLENGKMLLFIDYSNQELYSNKKINTRDDGTHNGNTIRPTNKVTASDEDNITLREERLVVDKDNVNLGEVVVNKYTDSEVEEFDVPVERDNVTVDRRPVEGEPLFETYNNDDSDDEMGVIRIPITKERIKIIKEQVVTEEIIIRKEKIKDTKHISEVVSHEDVEVTEVKNDADDLDNRKDQY